MAHHSLLSVGQLCDEGYKVTFQRDTVTICNSENCELLSGPRDETTGLWRINLTQPNKHKPDPVANNMYELCNTGALVNYLHKALFSPSKAAMLQAVKDCHQQAFETEACHCHGPYEPAAPEHKINLEGATCPTTITGPGLRK
jgi:hypothetical protein